MKTTTSNIKVCLVLVLTFVMVSCGAGSSADSAGTVVGNPESYPSSLAIASPVDASSDSSASVSAYLSAGRPLHTTAFSDTQTAISTMLTSTDIEDCGFDIEPLTQDESDADCYGPTVAYQGNPDGTLPNSGTLPPGDVGMWSETNTNVDNQTEACAAAELNALIEGANNKAGTAMFALASMICVANAESVDLTGTVDLTEQMTSMVTATSMDASFSSAVITVSTDASTSNTVYTYALQFTANDTTDDFEVNVNMQHMPENDDNSIYRGGFNYSFSQSNGASSNCGLSSQTVAGSVQYQQTAATNLKFKADSARYCGADINPFESSDILNPADTYETSNPDGWSDDWNTFTATMDPTSTEGKYAYFWQAGRNDSNARVFNLILATDDMGTTDDTADDVLAGDAYFGFGPSVDDEEADGHIGGFICNWAGPGASHDLSDYVQHQEITQGDDGLFTADLSDIAYAPTNSCNYLTTDADFGSFRYDADGSGSIDAGDPSATTAVTADLMAVTDLDNDGYLEEIDIALPVVIEGI